MQVSEKIYKECRQKVFGKRQILSWHKRKIPTLKAVNLIFKATSQRIGTWGAEDLAVVWAIETNFSLNPRNNANRDGSVDIGPCQISYPKWLGPKMNSVLRKKVLGTNLNGRQIFNGNSESNLRFAYKYVMKIMGGPVKYNPKSKARPAAVSKLKPELKKFFDCLQDTAKRA